MSSQTITVISDPDLGTISIVFEVTVIATGLDQESENEEANVINDENRYAIPDHNYNNPQTSINIINNNQENINEENKENNINDISSTTKEDDEPITVFGDDLDVPAYLRNKTIE